eukprot:GHVU01017847.1.p2 GENE.GHVU01017847.1~~GHVU01017847.1.p2  ORF type:complete len:123 (-),score=20.19 GHVU01017847.1:373-741(-)
MIANRLQQERMTFGKELEPSVVPPFPSCSSTLFSPSPPAGRLPALHEPPEAHQPAPLASRKTTNGKQARNNHDDQQMMRRSSSRTSDGGRKRGPGRRGGMNGKTTNERTYREGNIGKQIERA